MKSATRTAVGLACGLLLACGGSSGPRAPTDPPAPPTALVASAGSGALQLSWTAAAGASGYHVYRATAQGGAFARLTYQPVAGAAYADGAVIAGATYWYEVTAVNAAGESARSEVASATAPGTPPGPGACLGADLMAALGRTRFLVGFAGEDAVADAAPFDLRYQYLANAPMPAGTDTTQACTAYDWWGCWFRNADGTPGVANWVNAAAGRGEIPMFSYYVILAATGWSEGEGEVSGASDVGQMTAYLDDFRFLAQSIGSAQVLVQLEPDFWAYAQQYTINHELAESPHAVPAAVASADPTDCAGYENSIAGLGQCMVHILRRHAPNALVGLHASAWSTNFDAIYNTDPAFDVAGHAARTAAFLAEAGGAQADFLTVEMSDRDAGYYAVRPASEGGPRDTWWDASNATLPSFHQDQTWAKALAEAAGKPLLWWQVPVGNLSQDDTAHHYQDNRVQYFFDHPAEFAAAHGVGIAFGAGRDDQTAPSPAGDSGGDGGYLTGRTATLAGAGGVPACP